MPDAFGQQGVYAGRVRAFLHAGRVPEACCCRATRPMSFTPSDARRGVGIPGTRLWVYGTTCGRPSGLPTMSAGTTMASRADDVAALHSGDRSPQERTRPGSVDVILQRLVAASFDAGAVDFVITSYRASPDMLAALLRCAETAEATGIHRRPCRRTVSWPSRLGLTLCPLQTPCRRSLFEKGRSTTCYARASRTVRLRDGSSSHRRP